MSSTVEQKCGYVSTPLRVDGYVLPGPARFEAPFASDAPGVFLRAYRTGDTLLVTGHTTLAPGTRVRQYVLPVARRAEARVARNGCFATRMALTDLPDGTDLWIVLALDLAGDAETAPDQHQALRRVVCLTWQPETTATAVERPRPEPWHPRPEVELTNIQAHFEGSFIHIAGQTNLPTGARLKVRLDSGDSQAAEADATFTLVEQDGSFCTRLPAAGGRAGHDRLVVEFHPGDPWNLHGRHLYGPFGRTMTGACVVQDIYGRRAQVSVSLESPA